MLLLFFFAQWVGAYIINMDQGSVQLRSPLKVYSESDQRIKFTTIFTNTPGLALGISDLNYDYQVDFAYQTFAYGLTNSGFVLAIEGIKLNAMNVAWVAFDAQYGFTLYHNESDLQSTVWSRGGVQVTLQFPVTINYQPQFCVLLNGLGVQLGDVHNVALSVTSYTTTNITILIKSSSVNILTWVYMCVVVGDAALFYGNFITSPGLTTFNIITTSPIHFTQAYLLGFAGYTSNSTQGVSNNITNSIIVGDTLSASVQAYNGGDLSAYQVGLLVIRSACYFKCGSCAANSDTTCVACLGTRTLIGQACLCNVGYYEQKPASIMCNRCDMMCLNCSNATTCTACDTQTRVLSKTKCVCKSGFYELVDQSCGMCTPTCSTCVGSASKCLTCGQTTKQQMNRVLDGNVCVCLLQYFDARNICHNCSNLCQSCSLRANNCTSCNASNYRYQSTTNCLCHDGYFDVQDVTNHTLPLCSKCHTNCQTCAGSATNCLSCAPDLNLQLIGSKCVCKDPYYNYNLTGSYCMNDNIEQLQRHKMSSMELDMVDSLKALSRRLFDRQTGAGLFVYLLRRSTMFGLVANFDQPVAQLNYLNITYPLVVFEFERLMSLFIFDNVEDYLQENTQYNYSLFLGVENVASSNNVFNFQRVQVTPLFIQSGIDVLVSACLYATFTFTIYLYNRAHPQQDNSREALTVYRISENVNEQERQWVVWQARAYLKQHSLAISCCNFLFFWVLENKFAVFFASLLLQLTRPSFLTPLQTGSFILTLTCLLIIATFHTTNTLILRSTMRKRQVLKDMASMGTRQATHEDKVSDLTSCDYVEENNELLITKQNDDLLLRVTDALRQQEQRYIADLHLEHYWYHLLALLKKVLFVMICVLAVGHGEAQLWCLIVLHLLFVVVKVIVRPYTSAVRNLLVLVSDVLYVLVLGLKVNDLYNLVAFDASTTQQSRDRTLQAFMEKGRVTLIMEILYMAASVILQCGIVGSYLVRWSRCTAHVEEEVRAKRTLNLEVYEKSDFRRLLLELSELQQIRVLGNLTKIFREGDMIMDEFLEITYVFTCRHTTESQLQGHYSLSFKNANAKATLIIYQIQRELCTRVNGMKQLYQLRDDIQLDLPITLTPFQSCSMHQHFLIHAQDLEQVLQLSVSYQRVVADKRHQNLIIMEVQLAASINQILRNVDLSDAEAHQLYHQRDELVLKGGSTFVDAELATAFWSLGRQFLGVLIGSEEETETMLAKFLLPEMGSQDSNWLDVYLILERQHNTITIQVWHRRFGQFTTYTDSALYDRIMHNFYQSLIQFFS